MTLHCTLLIGELNKISYYLNFAGHNTDQLAFLLTYNLIYFTLMLPLYMKMFGITVAFNIMMDFLFNMSIHKIFPDCCVYMHVWKTDVIFLYKPWMLIICGRSKNKYSGYKLHHNHLVHMLPEQWSLYCSSCKRFILFFETSWWIKKVIRSPQQMLFSAYSRINKSINYLVSW